MPEVLNNFCPIDLVIVDNLHLLGNGYRTHEITAFTLNIHCTFP